MKYELSKPTRQQVRNAVLSGFIADSAAVPVLVTLVFVHREPFAWDYLVAGVASLAVSLVYLATLAVRRGGERPLAGARDEASSRDPVCAVLRRRVSSPTH